MQKDLQRNEGQVNMSLKLTAETMRNMEEQDGLEADVFSRSENDSHQFMFESTNTKNRGGTFLLQKVTKFEGILIEKVFFSNKNIYGNLMLSTCKQVKRANNPGASNDSSISSVLEGAGPTKIDRD